MKKFLFLALGVILATCYCACSSDDDKNEPVNPQETFSNQYFSIDKGEYVNEAIPEVGDTDPISGMTLNNAALTGGMNFATITTEKNYENFMIGVEGENGYWQVNASDVEQQSRASMRTFIIPFNFGTSYNKDIIIIILAIDNFGNIDSSKSNVQYVESKSGDLNVNLTFNNEKDIDLHLYTPSGHHIYYGNRGGDLVSYDENDEEETIEVGLDHDSNAACHIDGLNNENIFIPESLIEDGEYRVVVDMFSNCQPSISTNWALVVRYKGEIITPSFGSNPTSGVYEAHCGNDDMTTVMRFTINRGSRTISDNWTKVKPYPLSESARLKLENL